MKQSSSLNVLLFICAFMLVFAIVFQGFPPLFSLIISDLDISHAQAGALMSLFALPGILISIPGGLLADVYGAKTVGTLALVITLVGSVIVVFSGSYSMLVLGRLISGIGALTVSIIAPQVLSKQFAKDKLGQVMGIFNMVMPLGTIITLNAFGLIASLSSWRVPLLLVSTYSLVMLVLFYFKNPLVEQQQAARHLNFTSSLSMIRSAGWPIWLVAAIWMMYNAASISYLSFAGDYFVSQGYSVSYAGFLTSLLMVGALLISAFVGSLTDKYSNAEYLIAIGSIALAFLLWLVPRTSLNPLLIGSLIGIFAPLIPAPTFALVPKCLPRELTGLGYGILSTCLNIGVLVGPYVVGLSYDRTSSYLPGFNLMAVFSLVTAVFAFFLRQINPSQDG